MFRFMPINSSSSQKGQVTQINRNFAMLDKETVIKQFNGSNGEKLSIGKTGEDTLGMMVQNGDVKTMDIGLYDGQHYGLIFYDEAGVPVVLIGQAPDDGRMGAWAVSPGENVITLLGG